ncbi:MAG: hypothetical protein WBA13_04435 [Microcoleaceae cyanobacterium]
MLESEKLSSESNPKDWQKLDEFVVENKELFAALAWSFSQERADSGEFLGIELQPIPRFVACSQEALEIFNQNADNRLREMLGILDGYKPEEEVLFIAIESDRVRLVFFTPEPTPPQHFAQIGKDLYTLLDELEDKLVKEMGIQC